jgi:PAS domain S-box-containing protein
VIQRGLEGDEGTFRFRFRGVEKIGSAALVPETGWLTFMVQSEEEAFASIHRLRTILFVASIIIALAAMIVVRHFGRKAVSPLFRLAASMKKISEGDYQLDPRTRSYPEIDQMAESFMSMAETIKAREKALSESQERYHNLVEESFDGIFIQKGSTIVFANRRLSEMLGYAQGELLGLNHWLIYHPEYRDLTRERALARMRGERVAPQYEVKLQNKDGPWLYGEISAKPVDVEGEPGIQVWVKDITQRKLAEAAVKEREQRIQAILEATPDPLVVYDPKGNAQYINPAFTKVFGWTQDEVKGKEISFVPDDQREKTVKKIKALFEGREPGPLETRRLGKNGRVLDVLISASLIKGSEGSPSGMVVSLTDLTEKKQMEAGLAQVQKLEAIGVLAGGIAHDFNNLLMGIQGNTSLMLMDADEDHPFHGRLKDIGQYAQQGTMLTRQLLGFARGGKYEVKPLDLNTLIKEHNQLFSRTRKGVTIHEEYEKDLWTVSADENQMGQVLMNLYINAADAMPEGGDIFVRTMNVMVENNHGRPFEVTPGRYVHVSVRDTGTGMDHGTLQRIFEPFFTTKEVGRGTGLGLSSVYGIVKNHGGFVEVDSELGKGSAFHIHLPAFETRDPPQNRKEVVEGAPSKGQGTILVVDDEEMILNVGRQMLERIGYRVYVARSAKEAMALFEAHRAGIDLVILDMIMPEMGGGRLFDHLRTIDPEVKVLLSSGYGNDGQAWEILERGCKGFIQKPFSLVELSRKVTEILAGDR